MLVYFGMLISHIIMLIKQDMVLMVKPSIAAKKSIRLIGETMPMINLFEETDLALIHYQKEWNDIAWIGGKDFYMSSKQFIEAAEETNYDCGYGFEEVISRPQRNLPKAEEREYIALSIEFPRIDRRHCPVLLKDSARYPQARHT